MEQEASVYRRRYGVLALAAAAILLAVDQVTKYFVLLHLSNRGPMTLIAGLLEFSYVENTGAAFGLFKNMMWIIMLVCLAAFVVIGVLLFRYQNHTFFSYAASTLLLAGGVGNLLDRIFYGFVVDFIHVLFFNYIFNFADCCITVGAALFILHVLIISHREKNRNREEPASADKQE